MKAHKNYPCQCVICRYNRGEISDDYFKGYMQASFNEQSAFLWNMKELGYEPTRLTDDGTGGFLAVIRCDLDETAQILDELNGNTDLSEAIDISKLSPEGKKLYEDIMKSLRDEKNGAE